MKRTSHPFYLIVILVLSGCTLHYVPSAPPIEPASIPPFKVVGTVKLTNAQELSEDVSLPIPGFTITANFRQYTDLAIKSLRTELDKKSGGNAGAAEKEIKLAIVDLKMLPGSGNFRCILNFTATTGQGYIRGIEVIGASWNFKTAIDTAVANVAIGVLNDERILSYLEK